MSTSANELLTSMRTLLAEERDAIRKLDAKKVDEASRAKEKLLAAMKTAPSAERAELAAGLAELKGELRRNLILLAHARDSLRKVIEMCGSPMRGRLEARL